MKATTDNDTFILLFAHSYVKKKENHDMLAVRSSPQNKKLCLQVVLQCSNINSPPTTKDCCCLDYETGIKSNSNIPDTWAKEIAELEWFYKFMM